MFSFFSNKSQFNNFCISLEDNNNAKCDWNEPEKYPCLAHFHWYDDPNGPYRYTIDFLYMDDPVAEIIGEYFKQ